MRYTGPVRFRFTGDIGRARRNTARARSLIAQTFASSSVPLSSRSKTYDDGTVISIQYFSQPGTLDRDWVEDPLTLAAYGQLVVTAHIFALSGEVSIPGFTGFVLPHPNAAAFDNPVYGIFFSTQGQLDVTSPSSALDLALTTLDFLLGSPYYEETYPDELYDDIARLEHVDWHNEDHSICLVCAADSGSRELPRYNAIPTDKKLFRGGEVFIDIPLSGSLRGWGMESDPELLRVIMQSGLVLRAYSCPTALDMTVPENWIEDATVSLPSVSWELAGCFLFATGGTHAVTSVWNGDEWFELQYTPDGFEQGDTHFNPMQGFLFMKTVPGGDVFDSSFGEQENFSHYSEGGQIDQTEVDFAPPGNSPGVLFPGDTPDTIVTPYTAYRRAEFSYTPTVDIEEANYKAKKLVAIDYIAGTTTLTRWEIDYSEPLFDCSFDADNTYPGEITDTFGPVFIFGGDEVRQIVQIEKEESGVGQGVTLGRFREGDIQHDGVSLGWVVDVDTELEYNFTLEWTRTTSFPSGFSGSGIGSGTLTSLCTRLSREIIAGDLRYAHAAIAEFDQRYEYRVSEDQTWVATSQSGGTINFDRTTTPNGTYQRLKLIDRRDEQETEIMVRELPTDYGNLGPEDSIESESGSISSALSTQPSFEVTGFGAHFFLSGRPQITPDFVSYGPDSFPGWAVSASDPIRASNFTFYERPLDRFGYLREGAFRLMFPLQSTNVASLGSRRGRQAYTFFGQLYSGEGQVKEIVVGGRRLSTYFQPGAELLYSDRPLIGVV